MVSLHLSSGAVAITAAKLTAIEAVFTAWDAGPGAITETARLHPTESNKGVETDPNADANKLRVKLANLLERPDWGLSGGVEYALVR